MASAETRGIAGADSNEVPDSPLDRPGGTGRDRAPVLLDDHQRFLHRVLGEQDVMAATMYFGALQVLADVDNPDRLALAAHGVRELIEKLPRYFNLPVPIRGAMGNKVTDLHQAWKKVQPKPHADQPLPKPLWDKLNEFFTWRETEVPTWKQKTADLLRGLDPAGRPLPAPIAKLRVEQWLECNDFFVTSSHHGECSEEDFVQWLDFFEHFLLDLVRPRTFEHADRIDALIAEGERDG